MSKQTDILESLKLNRVNEFKTVGGETPSIKAIGNTNKPEEKKEEPRTSKTIDIEAERGRASKILDRLKYPEDDRKIVINLIEIGCEFLGARIYGNTGLITATLRLENTSEGAVNLKLIDSKRDSNYRLRIYSYIPEKNGRNESEISGPRDNVEEFIKKIIASVKKNKIKKDKPMSKQADILEELRNIREFVSTKPNNKNLGDLLKTPKYSDESKEEEENNLIVSTLLKILSRVGCKQRGFNFIESTKAHILDMDYGDPTKTFMRIVWIEKGKYISAYRALNNVITNRDLILKSERKDMLEFAEKLANWVKIQGDED